jgi:hypothetical protein
MLSLKNYFYLFTILSSTKNFKKAQKKNWHHLFPVINDDAATDNCEVFCTLLYRHAHRYSNVKNQEIGFYRHIMLGKKL